MLKGAVKLKRESGENPLQPPLLYTATSPQPPGDREGWRRMTREPGDLLLSRCRSFGGKGKAKV
jgi:hypothetical protein